MRRILLIAAGLVSVIPHVASAQDAAANADEYAKRVCGESGYVQLGYYTYEDCYSTEYVLYLDAHPQDNGGGDPPGDYDPPYPVIHCTGRVDCPK